MALGSLQLFLFFADNQSNYHKRFMRIKTITVSRVENCSSAFLITNFHVGVGFPTSVCQYPVFQEFWLLSLSEFSCFEGDVCCLLTENEDAHLLYTQV